MFSDNLKTLRKEKGFTQEELAIKLNVVRQTVSKWEKGLSVPDADILKRIADVLEVGVSELLGADIESDNNKNEVAEQLAKISEQMAIQNSRRKKIWKIIGFTLLSLLIIWIIMIVLAFPLYTTQTTTVSSPATEIESETDDIN